MNNSTTRKNWYNSGSIFTASGNFFDKPKVIAALCEHFLVNDDLTDAERQRLRFIQNVATWYLFKSYMCQEGPEQETGERLPQDLVDTIARYLDEKYPAPQEENAHE